MFADAGLAIEEVCSRNAGDLAVLKERLAVLRPLKAQLSQATAARDKAAVTVDSVRKDIEALRGLMDMRIVQLAEAEADARFKAAVVSKLLAEQLPAGGSETNGSLGHCGSAVAASALPQSHMSPAH